MTPPQRPTTISIKGRGIPVFGYEGMPCDLATIVDSANFLNWVRNMEKEQRLHLESVQIQSVDMFGPRPGFVKFTTRVLESASLKSAPIPGIVFMRGGSVAILVILECDGQKFTVVTRQPRIPIGSFDMIEIPAGMLDGSGHFTGVAAKELEEETGIKIDASELIDLTKMAYGNKYPGMYPSPGGCDEIIRLFAYKTSVTKAKLDELKGKCTGVIEEGERITVDVLPLQDLWKVTSDSKALSAMCLFDRLFPEEKTF
eukprot:TRINITY_DN27054_c0_g1_i1.p1 TRINITY_DN27054_c0_g1~~TRINITY_DN27054_c0_g1_i1.p1  ORF type:complete len:257 (+),score=59.72 TRINITY_DN27054_c0_g1_i1:177-947(+)